MNKSLTNQIASVRREIGMRERVYPLRIANNKMKAEQAEHELDCMRSVLATLINLSEDEFSLG